MARRDPLAPSPEAEARVARLHPELAYAVRERAAILIFAAGLAPDVADERALAEEARRPTQKTLGGV